MTPKPNMTIKEFSRKLGVSTATVSRAFSNKGRISARTRQYILEQAAIHNYHANIHARKKYVDDNLRVREQNIMDYASATDSWDVMYYLIEKHGMGNYLDSTECSGQGTIIEYMRHKDISKTDRQYQSYMEILDYYSRTHHLQTSSLEPKR